jgi:acetyl esterase/lipase
LRRSGIAAGHLAVGGDSAGGGLTVALINQLRKAGESIPGCAWLISPWTDLTLTGSTLATKDAVDPIIHRAYLAELTEAYLPETFDRRDPRVSPLFADLGGLPPTLIQVGACETLLEDSTRFARAAGAANVAVTLQIWPDMIHAFPMWNAHLEPGRRALAEAGHFIGEQLQRRTG